MPPLWSLYAQVLSLRFYRLTDTLVPARILQVYLRVSRMFSWRLNIGVISLQKGFWHPILKIQVFNPHRWRNWRQHNVLGTHNRPVKQHILPPHVTALDGTHSRICLLVSSNIQSKRLKPKYLSDTCRSVPLLLSTYILNSKYLLFGFSSVLRLMKSSLKWPISLLECGVRLSVQKYH